MEFTEKVIILRIGRFKEADLWVRFLSPTRGIMNAFAFGGCRSRRRFCGCLDHLNRVLFRVKGSKLATYFSLEEGTLMDSPENLRVSHERLGLAVNCQKFLEAMGISFEGAPAAYSLFSEMLVLLNEAETLDKLWPIFFRARFAFDQGYSPELNICQVCANDLKYPVFHVQEGVLTCAACARSQGPRFRLSKESLDALRFVQENSPLRWLELNLSVKARKELSRAIDGFIQYHIGLSWENGMFRRV